MAEKNERRTFDDGFKQQVVELYKAGQSYAQIAKTYNLSPTTVSNWCKYEENSGSFRVKDNLSEEEKRFREQEVTIKRQQMEIEILKKAMVVMLKN